MVKGVGSEVSRGQGGLRKQCCGSPHLQPLKGHVRDMSKCFSKTGPLCVTSA